MTPLAALSHFHQAPVNLDQLAVNATCWLTFFTAWYIATWLVEVAFERVGCLLKASLKRRRSTHRSIAVGYLP